MKNRIFLLAAICMAALNLRVFADEQLSGEIPYNYVVIGAFAIESNAVDHVETAKKLKYNAELAINPNRHLFYVYVLKTSDARMAFSEADKIRKATPFFDTW